MCACNPSAERIAVQQWRRLNLCELRQSLEAAVEATKIEAAVDAIKI